MRFQVLAFATSIAMANAAVIMTYSDTNCGSYVGKTNVYDNSCSNQPGFQSFKIVSPGGDFQQITSYSPNSCVAPSTACVPAGNVGTCYQAINGDGGSNALSSAPDCGTV